MRINFISQIDPLRFDGGGERTDRSLIAAGRDRGYDIRVSSAYPTAQYDLLDDPDLYILSGIHNQPSARTHIDRQLIDGIIRDKPYIHIDHAYTDVCDLPYLPCNGETDGKSCRHKLSVRTQSHRMHKRLGCFAASTREMYRRSLLNVFLAPLHKRVIEGIVGAESLGRTFLVRPMIDTSVFFDRSLPRDIDNLFVGSLTEAKGMAHLKERYPEENVTLAGNQGLGVDATFGRQLGFVPQEELPLLMNRALNFVFLPRWPEPMGRVVVEAALCGCNLIVNGNVGAVSFDFDLADPAGLAGAADEFWDELATVSGSKPIKVPVVSR